MSGKDEQIAWLCEENARLRKAAEYACDEHEKEDGVFCRLCPGMMELRAALAAAKGGE